jgi:hypothetical protein
MARLLGFDSREEAISLRRSLCDFWGLEERRGLDKMVCMVSHEGRKGEG